MNKKLICLLAFVFSLCMGFTACGDDDDDPVAPVELKLEKTTVSVEVGATVEVTITEGNGGYTVTPATPATATATESNKVITITGVAAGETDVEVKDKANKTATIKVTVTAKDLAPEVAGTYNGSLSVTIDENEAQIIDGQDIILERTDVNKVKLLLEDFAFGVAQVGDIEVNNIALTKETDGTVKLTDTTVDVTLAQGGIKAKVTVSSSTVKEGKMILNIDVTDVTDAVGEPLDGVENVTIAFEGTTPSTPTEE